MLVLLVFYSDVNYKIQVKALLIVMNLCYVRC